MNATRRLQGAVLILALGWALTGSARADVSYDFTLTGIIASVNDVATNTVTGQQFHYLPGLSTGDTITASGNFTANAAGQMSFVNLQVSAPASFGFQANYAPAIGNLIDPNNLSLGFVLDGIAVPSTHPAVVPTRAPFDDVTGFQFGGPNLFVNLFHNTLQAAPTDFSVTAAFETISIQPQAVPEPSALALLAAGGSGAWLLLARYRRATSQSTARKLA